MSEKIGNPFVAVDKPPAKKPKKIPTMVKALGLATALHAGVYHEPEIAEGARAGIEVVGENVERWRLERARDQAIERAQDEIRRGDLDFWSFARDTDRADIALRHETPPSPETVDRELAEVRSRLEAELHGLTEVHNEEDVRTVQRALTSAFDGYHYELGMSSDVLYVFADRGGKCDQISLAVLSVLDQEGFNHQLAIRAYPAGEQVPGHWAPTLTYTDEQGVMHEHDLVAGGQVYPGGTRVSLENLVKAYAEYPEQGWQMHIENDPEARPFPASVVPLFSERMIHAYQTDAVGNIRDAAGELLASADAGGGTVNLGERMGERITAASHARSAAYLATRTESNVLTRPERLWHGEGQTHIDTFEVATAPEWSELSREINWAEHALSQTHSTNERGAVLGLLMGMYRTASLHAALERRSQTHDLAEERIRALQPEAHVLLEAIRHGGVDVYSGWLEDSQWAAGLANMGPEGQRLLFDTDTSLARLDEPRGISRREVMDERAIILAALILAPESRSEALVRAGALSVHEQYILAEALDARGEGFILAGSDSFSISVHERRMFLPEWSLAVNDTAEGPAYGYFQYLQELIDRYAHEGELNQDWVNQVTMYLASKLADHLDKDDDETRRSMLEHSGRLFRDAIHWMRQHPETDQFGDAERLEAAILFARDTIVARDTITHDAGMEFK